MKRILLISGFTGIILFIGLKLNSNFFQSRTALQPVKKSETQHLPAGTGPKSGDIIFQTTESSQCRAVQLATHSIYSHCGLIFKDGNELYVFEAVQPVKWTRLDDWLSRGTGGKYVIKRLKNSDSVLTPEIVTKMRELTKSFNGKDYDLTFEWSDSKIYCSELVWKIYQRTTGIQVGKLQKIKDLDLTHEAVKKKMEERYGQDIPMEETVITPAAIFDSELLIKVDSN